MNYEVSKQLPAKPKLTCHWCGCALQPEKHLISKTRAVYRCPECGQSTNYRDVAFTPSLYEALLPDVRARLDDWVTDHFTPADEGNVDAANTYVLRQRYQALMRMYLYSGCLNGALLHLGFRPRGTLQTNRFFDMRCKKSIE